MSENTKIALANSLKELLSKKPFNKLTVEDITQNCGVSRMTFYYYFSDIYALVEWICDEDAKKLLENNKTYDTWQNGLLKIFNELLSNKTFFMNLCFNIDRLELEKYLYSITYDLMLSVVDEVSCDCEIKDVDKEFIAHFYKYAFVGILLEWIQGYMKDDPHEIVNRLEIILKGSIKTNIYNIIQNYL